MPKIKINELDGKPSTGGVALLDGSKLRPGETADVDDLAPFQALLDRNILVTVAGRPKKGPADAATANPDKD